MELSHDLTTSGEKRKSIALTAHSDPVFEAIFSVRSVLGIDLHAESSESRCSYPRTCEGACGGNHGDVKHDAYRRRCNVNKTLIITSNCNCNCCSFSYHTTITTKSSFHVRTLNCSPSFTFTFKLVCTSSRTFVSFPPHATTIRSFLAICKDA